MEPKKNALAALIVARGKPKDTSESGTGGGYEGPEAAMGGPEKADQDYQDEGLDAAASDMMEAFQSKDVQAFKEALKSFLDQCH